MKKASTIGKMLASAARITDETQRVRAMLHATNRLGTDVATQVLSQCEETIDGMENPELRVSLFSELIAYQDRLEQRLQQEKQRESDIEKRRQERESAAESTETKTK